MSLAVCVQWCFGQNPAKVLRRLATFNLIQWAVIVGGQRQDHECKHSASAGNRICIRRKLRDVDAVDPGSYNVDVSQSGFRTVTRENVVVPHRKPTTQFQLEIGTPSESH